MFAQFISIAKESKHSDNTEDHLAEHSSDSDQEVNTVEEIRIVHQFESDENEEEVEDDVRIDALRNWRSNLSYNARNPGAYRIAGSALDEAACTTRTSSLPQLPVARPFTQDVIANGEEVVIDGRTISHFDNERVRKGFKRFMGFFTAVFTTTLIVLITRMISVSRTNRLQVTETITPATGISKSLKDIFIQVSREDVLDDPKSIQHYVWQKLALDFPVHVLDRPLDLVDDENIIIQRYVLMVAGLSSMLDFFSTFENVVRDERRIAYDCDDFNCNENGEISVYVLENRGATERAGGLIATEIGHLSSISHLILRRGKYKRTIPTEIGMLKNLRVLDLSQNFFTGTIPSEISALTKLEWLVLKENLLTGRIPTSLQNLQNLVYADFSRNAFTGSIPSGLRSLQNLQGLSLYDNDITGSVNALCDLEFTEDFFFDEQEIGRARGVDRFYTYEANFSLTVDCRISCICCKCKS